MRSRLMLFLLVRYNLIAHPTIATFVRVTIGFGVLLFPVYIPALMIGSMRCERLLAKTEIQLATSTSDNEDQP